MSKNNDFDSFEAHEEPAGEETGEIVDKDWAGASGSEETGEIIDKDRSGEIVEKPTRPRRQWRVSPQLVRGLAAAIAVIALGLGAYFVYSLIQDERRRGEELASKLEVAQGKLAPLQSRVDSLANELDTTKDNLDTTREDLGKQIEAEKDRADQAVADVGQIKQQAAAEVTQAKAELEELRAQLPREPDRSELDQAVQLALDPEPAKVEAGIRRIVDLALDSDGPDGTIRRLAPALAEHREAVIAACEARSKETTGRERALYRTLKMYLDRAATRSDAPPAEPPAREGRAGEPAIRRASRPASHPRRLVRTTALQDGPQGPLAGIDARIREAEELIQDDPTMPSGYLFRAEAQAERARVLAARDPAQAAQQYEQAVASFQEGINRITEKNDPDGDLRRDLASGLIRVTTARLALAVATTPPTPPIVPPVPGANPGPREVELERQLRQARGELSTTRGALRNAEQQKEQFRTDMRTAQGQLDEARGQSRLFEGAARDWTEFAEGIARLVGVPYPPPGATAPWNPRDEATRSWIEALSSAAEARLRNDGGDDGGGWPLPGRLEDAYAAFETGINRLFAADYPEAIREFTRAIAEDPRDARFYYFRGIARYLAAGGPIPEAEADVRRGVSLERANSPTPKQVSESLVRIQFDVRNWVEARRNLNDDPAPSLSPSLQPRLEPFPPCPPSVLTRLSP